MPLIRILCSFLTSHGACSSSSKLCAAFLQLLLQSLRPRRRSSLLRSAIHAGNSIQVLRAPSICKIRHIDWLVRSMLSNCRFRVRIMFSSQANPFYSVLFRPRVQGCFNWILSPRQTRSDRRPTSSFHSLTSAGPEFNSLGSGYNPNFLIFRSDADGPRPRSMSAIPSPPRSL
jgi:hypothetical protein